MEFLAALNDAILALATSPWAVVAVLVVCIVDAFFPPIPSETVLVAAVATATAAGEPGMVLIFALVGAIGAIIGDSTSYWIGRGIGLERWQRSSSSARAGLGWARRELDRRTAVILLVSRYIPGGRVLVTMASGATRLPYRRFLPLSMLAGTSWALLTTALGALAGAWLKDYPLAAAAIGIAIALVLGLVLDRLLRPRLRDELRSGSAEPEDAAEPIHAGAGAPTA